MTFREIKIPRVIRKSSHSAEKIYFIEQGSTNKVEMEVLQTEST